MNYIGLIDCNNFFVSCERVFRPDLKRRPVVVLSSNDGCVVARSQEIKDIGIPMGVPYFQVKDILVQNDAVVFSSNFTLYRDISRRVFEVVRTELDSFEQYSIDECFFSFPGEGIEDLAKRLRQRIEREVGITVSIGMAPSKTIAKYANGLAKKTNGIKKLSLSEWVEIAPTITLSDLWGVGYRRARAFKQRGITTPEELGNLPPTLVKTWFGVDGLRLQAELLGNPALPVTGQVTPKKSIASTRSFAKETTSEAVVFDALSFHLHQVVSSLSEHNQVAKKMTILLYPNRYGDYVLQGVSVGVEFTYPTRNIMTMQTALKGLMKSAFKATIPYKKVGVICTELSSEETASLSLFEDIVTEQDGLTCLLSKLTKLHGKEVIQLGRLAKTKASWQARKGLLSPEYTTAWEGIKLVKA